MTVTSGDPPAPGLGDLLDEALATGDDRRLRTALVMSGSGHRGPHFQLLLSTFAGAVGQVIRGADPPVARLENLLDGWAAIPARDAPADGPEVVLPCAAIAAYGEAGVVRADWFDDEVAKLRRAAADRRPRVGAVVIHALRRLLDADPMRTRTALRGWADDDDPLVVGTAERALAEGLQPGRGDAGW